MAQPVWVLSVDLQTKTATFTSGLSDAARSARGSFNEIRDGAKEMSDGVRGASGQMNYSMMEARHSVMILAKSLEHISRVPLRPSWLPLVLSARLLKRHSPSSP